MRMSDADPLPGLPIAPLARTYDSRVTPVRRFGRGWTSVFDELLHSEGGSDGRRFVVITTEHDDRVVFGRDGTTYVQVWPTGTQSGTLSYDSTSASFSYREAGTSFVRLYSASDGRLTAMRSLSGQYEARITYTNGLPSSVEDSRGAWRWTIGVNPNGTINAITVDGHADLAWSYGYDDAGNLGSVSVAGTTWRTYTYGGGAMTAAYDGDGNLLEAHTYDANGNAVSSTAEADDVTSIDYAAPGARVTGEQVTRVTYATGRTTDYFSRFIGGRMRSVEIRGSCNCGSDEGSFAYDASGNLVRAQNASGYITLSTYDSRGNMTSTTTAMRPATCDPATAADHCRLDADALAAATPVATDATLTTTYTYDPVWPEKIASVVTPSLTVPGRQRSEARGYHPLTGEVVATVSRGWAAGAEPSRMEAATMTLCYGDVPPSNGAGDGDGAQPDMSPAFDPGGTFLSSWLTLAQPTGLPKSTDGPRTDVADVTLFVYYPVDNAVPVSLRGRLAAVKDAAGHITRFETYDVFGNATRVVEPNGVATESAFNALGRLASTTIKGVAGCDTTADPLCATDLTTTRTYTAAGRMATEQLPGGGTTVYTYDSRGRVATLSRGPTASDLRERIAYTYDAATGKKSLEQYLGYENGAWSEKRREAYAYDLLGRLIAVTHADNTTIRYTYDAENRLASVQDENHATPNTTYAYDPAGRLVKVTQTLSTATNGQIATAYGYDVFGNLTAVTDPNGNTTTYAFDDFARMAKQTSPVSGETAYTYDLAGNLLTTTDANGATTTRSYDALGRALTAGSARSGMTTETLTWTYDDATAGSFGIGRLATMSDPAGNATYRYERHGLLRSETHHFTEGSYDYTTTFTYDRDGNRSSVEYPSGQLSVAYTFDYAGRPLTASGAVTSAEYRPFGPLSKLRFANGTTQTFEPDTRYRVGANALSVDNAPPQSATIARYVYGYDNAGNVTNLQDATDTTYHRTFSYDDLNRLVRADTPRDDPAQPSSLWGTATYTWDAMGNILTADMATVIPGGPDNLARTNPKRFQPPNRPRHRTQVQTLGRSLAFTYQGTTSVLTAVTLNDLLHTVGSDSAGNETSYVATRSYSPRNMLSDVRDQTDPEESLPHSLHYGYDGRGVRVERTETPSNGPATSAHRFYLYTPELRLLAGTRDDAVNVWGGNPPTTFGKNVDYEIVWFGDRPVAQTPPGGATLYTFADHLGTPILQTDSTATIQWRVEYEPFGNVYEVRAGTRTDQPLRFPGQELAMTWEGPEENFNVFRWYGSGWGRYTQADPLRTGIFLQLGGSAPALSQATSVRASRSMLNTFLPDWYAYVGDSPIGHTDPLGLLRDCDQEQIDCFRSCWNDCPPWPIKKGNAGHYRYCQTKCLVEYMECVAENEAEKLKKKFFNNPPHLPPFVPIPPLPPPAPEPVIPSLPPILNPCMLKPSLCYSPGGPA